MRNRLKLHETLKTVLGSNNVYFQPPETIKMKYPAIRYKMSNTNESFANDKIYKNMTGYEIILIDINPESEYINDIIQLPYCRFVNAYIADGLNHFVFEIYDL